MDPKKAGSLLKGKPDDLLTIRMAADLARRSVHTIAEWIASRELSATGWPWRLTAGGPRSGARGNQVTVVLDEPMIRRADLIAAVALRGGVRLVREE